MASLLPYLQRLEITGVEESDTPTTVNNYVTIKEIVEVVDQEGNPWEPVPGPDPWDDLVVCNVTKISNGSFVNPSEVYSFQSVTPIPATFTGGSGTLVIETRLQKYAGSTASWVNVNNYTTTPATVPVSGLEPGTKLRAQTRATDTDAGETVTSSSSATPRVGVTTTIGTVTITPEPLAIAAGLSQMFNSVITGGTATNFNYQWSVRSGSAQLMSGNNISDEALYRFDNPGTTQIQVYVSDTSASNSPQSFVATIIVS